MVGGEAALSRLTRGWSEVSTLCRRVSVARAQEGTQKAPTEPFVNQQRVVQVLVVEAVVLEELLLAVGGVVGAVDFEDDDSRSLVAVDEAVG